MRAKAAAFLFATLALWGCSNQDSALKPIKRAKLKSRPAVPASEWREELRSAYRLHPDVRFLLAFGEIERLAGTLPAPPGKAATATFADGRWTVEVADSKVGTLPDLPDFSDYLPLLVAYAKSTIHGGSASSASRSAGAGQDLFLMPDLLKGIQAAETSLGKDQSYRDAARCFARVAFQMADRLELAPLISARALALLAAARARDARAGLEEEVLLAHALGYTAYAEKLAGTLPSDAPLRAFEALDERALEQTASRPGASEEVRYLAVKRATSHGDLGRWKEARARFMAGNNSVAVMATALDIELPHQLEVTERSNLLVEALPRAVLREFAKSPSSTRPGFEGIDEFHTKLEGAVQAAKGSLWDGAAVDAYYEAAYYSALEAGRWPPSVQTGVGARLLELSSADKTTPPNPRGDTRGAPLILQRIHQRYQTAPPGREQMFMEIRALMSWLDSRPRYRSELAGFGRYQLSDPRAAEDLYGSLVQVLGDVSRKTKAEAAIYVGDSATLHRLLGSPALTVPEATAILWSCYVSKVEPAQLMAEYERLIDRFPNDWNATNYYIDFLRKQKNYQRSCEIVERWLVRNPDPRTPGHFHAQVRLAHNYALNHEYEKGLKLLQKLSESEGFQQGNSKRGMAECLVGLKRFPEAEARAREAVALLKYQAEAYRELIKTLWAVGKDAEAVDLLAARKAPLEGWEVCDALRNEFSEVFLERPTVDLMRAVDVIAKKPDLKDKACAIEGFAIAGRWEDALRIADRLSPPTPERMDQLIVQYGYMKSWKGREAAAAWLKEKIPPDKRNPLSMKALYTKNDDLLWDVIGTPNPKDHPEWVWLFRAVAFALRGSDADPHRAELLAYYEKDNRDSYHIMGRYLVGLGSEADMFALAAASRSRSEVAYYLGARAQHDKRFRDACEWYRVAAESGESTSPRSLAFHTLGEWVELGQGIWTLEAEEKEKK